MDIITIVNRNDMVNYICISLISDGITVNEELIHAVLDAREDFIDDYAHTHEEE